MSNLSSPESEQVLNKTTDPQGIGRLIPLLENAFGNKKVSNYLFLTPDEIFDLTGLQQPCAQKKWLAANDWIFQVDARGRPKIARAFFDKKMTQHPSEAISNLSSPKEYAVNTQALRRP